MGNCFDNEGCNECLRVLVVLLPFCHSVPRTLPLFCVIKMTARGCRIVKRINTARVEAKGGREGKGRGGVKGEAGEWVLNPTGWDFKGSLLNQICSHPITDCSLHLDKGWREGRGADSGMRMREGADGGGGRVTERVVSVRRGLWTSVGPVRVALCSLHPHFSWELPTGYKSESPVLGPTHKTKS